jgi:hypothetical protein
VWVGDYSVNALERPQTLNILVSAGIKTREEARVDLRLSPAGGKWPAAGVKLRGEHPGALVDEGWNDVTNQTGAICTI